MSHQPEDPAETAEWETQKRATAERKPWATIGPVPTHGPDFIDLLAAPPAEPAQPPTGSCGCTAEPRNWAAIGSEDFTQLECAPAGLTPEQTIRHHAVREAGSLALARGEVDPPVFWDDVTAIAAYIRDGSRP